MSTQPSDTPPSGKTATQSPGNAGLWLAGGLALGVMAGMLLPPPRKGGAGKGLSGPARAALGFAGELGLAVAVRALGSGSSETDASAQTVPVAETPARPALPAHHAVVEEIASRFPAPGPAAGLLAKLWDRRKSR